MLDFIASLNKTEVSMAPQDINDLFFQPCNSFTFQV